MGDRQNTIVCIFDHKSPRITAYQIHEWLHEEMHLQEEDVRMIQIDGPQRRVYIKLVSTERMMAVFQIAKGQLEYRHENGELSMVQAEIAGLGGQTGAYSEPTPGNSRQDTKGSLVKIWRDKKDHRRAMVADI